MDFLGTDVPLPDSRDGVKLGESALKRFLLLEQAISTMGLFAGVSGVIHLSDWCAALSL